MAEHLAPPSRTLGELERDAAELWATLPHGAVVWLSGDLGAGKTTFVQAVARAARAGPARSPSFALVHWYPSPEGPLIHVDCYRLRSPAEAADLELHALAREARMLLVEWPERAGPHVPPPDAHLVLAHGERPDERNIVRVR